MHGIASRFHRELAHFRAMPEEARLLSASYVLRSAAYPLISIFTGAYIWQTNKDLTLLILYYIGNFLVLPPVFLLNKWLLAHIRLKKLYAASVVMTGLSSLMVVFYRSHTPEAYILYGMLYGLANGIYWANRNFLTVRHTTSETRSYFTGLQFTLSTMTSIVVPFLAGWLIVTGVSSHIIPSAQIAYEILIGCAFAMLLSAGLIVRGTILEQPTLTDRHAKPFSKAWRHARFLSVALGCADAPLYVLPTVLVLQAIGNEAVLGSLTSGVAVITAITTYIFGRTYRQRTFYPVFLVLLLLFVIAGLPLMSGITSMTALTYIMIANFTDNLIWTANEPKILDMIDEESRRSHISHYRIIVDREWFINIGRVGMYGIFLALTYINQELAIRLSAVISGMIAILFTLPALPKKNGGS